MSERRKQYGRRPRVPGTFRSHEPRGPSEQVEPQRLTLYVTPADLDEADRQALRAGARSVQQYCEALLASGLEAGRVADPTPDEESRRARVESLLAIASDPEYLAEWSATLLDRPVEPEAEAESPPVAELVMERSAASIVAAHAGLEGDDPAGLLACLRRGTPADPAAVRVLLRSLAELEAEHRDATALDRRLAYALHKLAFEGQVLATETAGPEADAATVELLRLVQEGVDRVLSGLDIRYFPQEP